MGFGCADEGCVGALGGAEDAVAGFEAVVVSFIGDGEDCAGEFVAGCPGEFGLVLVFSGNLEEVEEVCG